MDLKLAETVAVVTGGSRGIGKAVCLSLAAEGSTVMAVARDRDRLGALASEAKSQGIRGAIIPCPLDVSQREQIDAFVDKVSEDRGRIDILVNNAGITRDGLLASMDDDQFDEVLTVNLRSVFWLTRAVSKLMIRARKGRLINISSISGVSGNAGQANYAASKAGLIGFSKSVAKELAKRNITCNVVAPGFITTDMTDSLPDSVKEGVLPMIPLRRFGLPEDVAQVVAFLAGEGSAYVTGQVIIVDGGMRM